VTSPKKLAILSDIHGDLGSLQDALLHIEREACDAIICAGDYVDYGPAPDETIALLQQCGATCIRGNHDRWQLEAAAERSRTPPTEDDHLSEASFAFLASLPTDLHVTFAGVRVAIWHASPGSDMHKLVPDRAHAGDVQGWLATCAAEVLVVGHSHRVRAARRGRRHDRQPRHLAPH
jgi:predicted phosphodiesterase